MGFSPITAVLIQPAYTLTTWILNIENCDDALSYRYFSEVYQECFTTNQTVFP